MAIVKPILHVALFSPPARACMLCAKLLGLDVELRFVDFSKKEHLSADFVKLNPQHTVPVLVDEGESIWDSHAIMAYMVGKWAKDDKLYPKDLLIRARIDQRMHYENGVLFQVIKDFVNRIIYGNETEINQKSVELAHNAYGFLEKFLEHDYVVCNHMTIADISIHTTAITLQKLVPIERAIYPNLSLWIQRMNLQLPDNKEVNEAGAEILYQRFMSCLEDNRVKAGKA